jgi:CubicO group peptidase (beta-lactamase class C family)
MSTAAVMNDGKVGRDPDAGPVDQYTLYQMGSTSKSFTVAVFLQVASPGQRPSHA